MFNHAPTEQHRVQLRFGWLPLGHDLRFYLPIDICVLNQYAATDRAQINRGPRVLCRSQQSNQPQVFLRLQDRARFDLKIWRNDYFAENFADHFRQRLGQGPVAHDDPAKWRLFVRCKRLVPSLTKVGVRTDSARIGMF